MRGRRYAVNGDQNIASGTVSLLGITGGTAVEPSIYFMSIGCQDTPADNAIEWYIAAGTATAVTPQNLGPSTVASTTAAGKNHTAEPTYTSNAILWRMGLNQRASHTICFDPEGGLSVPATANNGLGLYPVHASATPNCNGTFHFME
jgi:hypothetical protein